MLIFFLNKVGRETIVVTGDQGLRNRCRSAARMGRGRTNLELVSPLKFLNDLEQVVPGFRSCPCGNSVGSMNFVSLENLQEEITLRGSLIELDAKIRKRRGSPTKRENLVKHHDFLQNQLRDEESSVFDQIISLLERESDCVGLESIMALPEKERERLLVRWSVKRGRTGTRREMTKDRIVLAERLRKQVQLILEPFTSINALKNRNNGYNPKGTDYVRTESIRVYMGCLNRLHTGTFPAQ